MFPLPPPSAGQKASSEHVRLNLWIIWGALVVSVVLYGAMVLLVSLPTSPAGAGADPNVLIVLGALALTELLGQAFGAGLLARLTRRVQAYFVVRWAIIDSVAVYGFVANALYRDTNLALAFIGAALLTMGLAAPTTAQVERFERLSAEAAD